MFALCKKFQLFFCLGERLSVYSDIDTMSILAQTESKELDFLLCEDTGHLALFRVHFQFQPAFQILSAGFQQTLRRSFAFGKYHNVICIPNQLHPSVVHLPIKFIEVDVCQQWRQRPALRRTFFGFADYSVLHHSASQIPLYHLNHPFIFYISAQDIYQ